MKESSKPTNIAASVRARLLNLAKSRGENFDFVLNRYGSERLLYRLGESDYSSRFILKGATLFAVWSNTPHRPTRDLDLLGFGEPEARSILNLFREILATSNIEDDGLVFDASSLRAQKIKEEEEYEGVRVSLFAVLLGARIPLQIDIGFGDVVTPAPEVTELPTMLGQSAPRLRIYPRETVIAEKFEAMVKLASNNSRMKDFYDVWVLSRAGEFDEDTLRRAIQATFARRQTDLPQELPFALRDEFGSDANKTMQWNAFCRKNGIENVSDFSVVVRDLRYFLWPLVSS